jgi:formylglycine-generating enzyme required for sulfatase activity
LFFGSATFANILRCEFALDDIKPTILNSIHLKTETSDQHLREIAEILVKLESSFTTDPNFVSNFAYRVRQIDKLKFDLEQLFLQGGRDIYLEEKLKQIKKVREFNNNQLKSQKVRTYEIEQLTDLNRVYPLGRRMHTIMPGSFKMGKSEIITEISEPFDIMEGQVTQFVYATLKIASGEQDPHKINPSIFKTGRDSKIENIQGLKIQINADHPVENISWYDAITFIDDLNRLSRAYDPKVQELLKNLFSGHRRGAVYDLPTDAQWEFVIKKQDSDNGDLTPSNSIISLLEHSWFLNNSRGQTHPVAILLPRIINGRTIYDLEGNVSEWIKDSWDGIIEPLGGKDPIGTIGDFRITRGGNFRDSPDSLSSIRRQPYLPDSTRDDVGMRLIRYSPK